MKRLVVLIMMLTICLGICACNKNTEPAKGSNSTEPLTVNEPIQMGKVTEPATEPMSKEEALALLRTTVTDLLAKTGNFSHTAFSGDETRINFGVAIDGLMTELYYAKEAGHDESYETWVEVKEYMLEHYDTICETAERYGLADAKIYLYVLNDANTSLAILTICDGAVIEDYMSQ